MLWRTWLKHCVAMRMNVGDKRRSSAKNVRNRTSFYDKGESIISILCPGRKTPPLSTRTKIPSCGIIQVPSR